jgi:hypothetical protein|tara:strand:- start:1770 stop:2555 length:786 start_codon:yes stop_codon:yes gene_type:complete
MLKMVISTMGDSVSPSLSLLVSNVSTSITFFYTSENIKNAESLQYFCQQRFPETLVHFLELPSIAMPGEIVKYAKEFMSGKNEKVGIFLTSGAKQTIFPFLINSTTSTTVSLVHSPLRIVVDEFPLPSKTVYVELSLQDLLASRGWEISEEDGKTLRRGDLVISGVSALFDKERGLLIFMGQSYLLKTGKEDEIHSLSRSMKNQVKEKDQITISNLTLLSEFFGRNGANYVISGALRSPNRSVLPHFIENKLVESSLQEEE